MVDIQTRHYLTPVACDDEAQARALKSAIDGSSNDRRLVFESDPRETFKPLEIDSSRRIPVEIRGRMEPAVDLRAMSDEQIADIVNVVLGGLGHAPADLVLVEILEQAIRRLRRAAGGPLHIDETKS